MHENISNVHIGNADDMNFQIKYITEIFIIHASIAPS